MTVVKRIANGGAEISPAALTLSDLADQGYRKYAFSLL